MTQSPTGWHIIQDASNSEAYSLLSQDPVWNSFALADLELPLRTYSQFALAYQDDSHEKAICLILRHPIIGQVISPYGSSQGIAELLKVLDLPATVLIQAQEIHMPLLQEYYRPATAWRKMFRMAVSASSFLPSPRKPPHEVRRLTTVDLPALEDLYATHGETPFSAELFAQGLFFGAFDQKRLIAAGGTHVIVPDHRLAVLGYILTVPEARKQGYATAITAALVTTLLQQTQATVILNVFEDNSNALRVYSGLGFQTHHKLAEGKALLLEKHRQLAPE